MCIRDSPGTVLDVETFRTATAIVNQLPASEADAAKCTQTHPGPGDGEPATPCTGLKPVLTSEVADSTSGPTAQEGERANKVHKTLEAASVAAAQVDAQGGWTCGQCAKVSKTSDAREKEKARK